jgi:hypothetical protein
MKLKPYLTTLLLTAGLIQQLLCINSMAQTAPTVDLPPGVQDVVKLVKAGLSEDVILAHIRNAQAYYSLSADQIIFLHNQNVAQSEIAALLGPGSPAASASVTPASVAPGPPLNVPVAAPAPMAPALAPAPIPTPATALYAPAPAMLTAPPALAVSTPQSPSLDSFRMQLSPYGAWVDVPGYGLCWRPSVAATDPYWRPYCDQGHWSYTAEGWLWQSDYPWGDVVFHYGRWYRDTLGWVWVPGYDWAPAWVCWRQAEGYCGWAPLPPGAVFKPGIGLWFGGHLAVDVGFGLGADAFMFVPYDRFWDHNLHAFLLPHERLVIVFGRSEIRNGYRVEHGRFVVEGLGRERMVVLTHHEIRISESGRHGEFRAHEDAERRTLHEEHRDRPGH